MLYISIVSYYGYDMSITDEKILHLGADLDRDFVLGFRDYCRLNDFKQKTVIKRLVEFWLAQDPTDQENLYRGRLQKIVGEVITPEPKISESIEMVKHFVKFKLPSPEEQRMIASLRQALSPEPKKERKRKRG